MTMLRPVRVTPPADLVSLEEAKRHLRVDGADEDTHIALLIRAAIGYLDGWPGILHRCLVTQTWREMFAAWPANGLLLLRVGPSRAVTTLVYSDADNTEQTINAADYSGPYAGACGEYLVLKQEILALALYDRPDAIRVTYSAGDAANDVPSEARLAVLMLVEDAFINRGLKMGGNLRDNPQFNALVDALRHAPRVDLI